MIVPNDQSILCLPDIWIIDAMARSHDTMHSTGVIEILSPVATDSVIVSIGYKIEATKVSIIESSIANKYGEIVHHNTILNNVKVLPESKFNLISVSVLHNG